MIDKSRKCKDCDKLIAFIPRKVRCIDCYKIYTNFTTIPVTFINDDD